MEKKFKFSDNSAVSKIVYLTVIAILCVSAIVIGIVAANNRKKTPQEDPPASEGENNGSTDGGTEGDGSGDGENNGGSSEGNKDENSSGAITYISPLVGTVLKSHSTTVPVFSNTLDAWRIHTGIDILCDSGAEVYASADGEVSSVFCDPMLGQTVEITHTDNVKTYYSNLSAENLSVSVGDKVEQGDLLGVVGDSTVIEIADEPHLHFELKVNSESVNPLDYITEDSKNASLGIVSGSET